MMPIVEIYPYAWMYFISFVVLSSIIVLNLFVAILVDVVSERRKKLEAEKWVIAEHNCSIIKYNNFFKMEK